MNKFNKACVGKILKQPYPGATGCPKPSANARDVRDMGLISRSGRSPQMATGAHHSSSSLVAQMVRSLTSMWETWVQSLGREDPLEKEMATHSSILA